MTTDNDIAAILNVGDVPRRRLLQDIKDVFGRAAKHHPRNAQKELGPSEIGTHCKLQLAYGLTATGKCNTFGDPMPSVRGIAMHTWMEAALKLENTRLGRDRWIPETKVAAWIGPGGVGTCDALDTDTNTVVDWKFPGAGRYKTYSKELPWKYDVQRHIYGAGYAAMGFQVDWVAVCLFNPCGWLSDTVLHMEPFDPLIAEQARAQVAEVQALIELHDITNRPENFALIPKTPSEECDICSWWNPNPHTPRQCSGRE